MSRVLLLHPGAMGTSIGAAMKKAGHDVFWFARGRSDQSAVRAREHGFKAVDGSLPTNLDYVVSVCPPDAALTVAKQIVQTDFRGTYIDGNAVSPSTMAAIGGLFGERLVDGGIVGPPAWREGTTRFFLSGTRAGDAELLFRGSLVETVQCGADVGAASALKMAYAGYTKGNSALLMGIRALAASYGVEAPLLEEWRRSQPEVEKRSEGAARGSGPKAWRFAGEMREIATTFQHAGLPDGFHIGAADLYERLGELKDRQDVTIEDVIRSLVREGTP